MDHVTELRHFGVKGMKWGVRKAVGEYASAVGQGVKDSYAHPILSDRAFKESVAASGSTKTKARRLLVYSKTSEIKDMNARTAKLIAAKKQKMSDMTPAQRNMHRYRVTMLVANSALAGANLTAAMAPKNKIRGFNAIVGVANTAAAAKMAKELKDE